MSNTYLTIRSIVRVVFWSIVAIGSMVLAETIGKVLF